MLKSLIKVGILLLVFTVGVVSGVIWKSRRSQVSPAPVTVQGTNGDTWPLTKEIVSRSLQSHSFTTDKLRRNSHDEIVWRWLKESIAAYPQNWVRLDISNEESYGVVLYPQKRLESSTIRQYNRELNEKRLPPLQEDKHYRRIQVYKDNIICPNWEGFIDVEEAKLVYFIGMSA